MANDMRTFRPDYGVYTCPHVFRGERQVLFVVRDTDGTWQFLCGHDDDEDLEGCHLIEVGHLLDRDLSLAVVAELDAGTFAEREVTASDWQIGGLKADD